MTKAARERGNRRATRRQARREGRRGSEGSGAGAGGNKGVRLALVSALSAAVAVAAGAGVVHASEGTAGAGTRGTATTGAGTGVHEDIIGGEKAGAAYPSAVSLQKKRGADPDAHHCGGTLIRADWVVTAAHCVAKTEAADPKSFHIRVGSADRTSGGTVARAKRFVVHPRWTYHKDRETGNDIALIQLAEKVPQKPAALAAKTPAAGRFVRAVGWGYTRASDDDPKQLPTRLRKIDLKVLKPSTGKCVKNKQDGSAWGIRKGDFCTNNPGGKGGTCGGDSGASALTRTKGADRWRLAGVTSRSVGGCGTTPDIFTSVPAHRGWIAGVVG